MPASSWPGARHCPIGRAPCPAQNGAMHAPHHITSWKHFNDSNAERDGWAFRGEVSASWQLLSSLSRRLAARGVPREQWGEREERAMRIFRRKAHVYLPDGSILGDDLR